MDKIKDLTSGSIFRVVGSLAAPLIAASFVQMAYTMTDMFWLGRLGSSAVAAVGAAAFFTWLNNALSYTPKIGTEITVAQSLGAGNREGAHGYAQTGISLSLIMSVAYGLIVMIAAPLMIAIFNMEEGITASGVEYLRWVIPGMFAGFNVNTFASVYYGAGNSKLPFRMIGLGLIMNIILDPLFIFGLGPLPGLGTKGAAIATSLAQLFVFLLFALRLYSRRSPLKKFKLFAVTSGQQLIQIIQLGLPVSLQSSLFSAIGMTLGSFASRFGHVGIAAQSLGSQIEAVSWMTASGFSTALGSFVAQNYGAGYMDRIKQGYYITLLMAGSIGLSATLAFVFFPETIFGLFISEPDALREGAIYLRIMGYSQLWMVIELVTTGGFNGVGKTQIPAYTGISLNLLRIPLSLFLMDSALQLSGIWWSITISSTLKGLVLAIWFYFGVIRRLNIMCKLQSLK
ncbi:MAG: MATE family efflux transporter [Bacteroidales bacterium]